MWRWSLAPGITALQETSEPYTCANAQITDAAQRPQFVGGATDGWFGLSAQDLRRIDAGSTLVARKSWFFTDAGVVALGAGISADGLYNVATSIEQRPLDTASDGAWVAFSSTPGAKPVQLPANTLLESANISWVWHAGVLYALQLAGNLVNASTAAVPAVSTRNQSGSWAAITQGPNTTITIPTFLAYFHHGFLQQTSAADYAYAIMPGIATPQAAVLAYSILMASTVILHNSPDVQAVCVAAPNASTAWMLQVVAWPAAPNRTEAAWLNTDGHSKSKMRYRVRGDAVSQCAAADVVGPPCLVLAVMMNNGTLAVTFADPAAAEAPPNVSVSFAGLRATGPACAYDALLNATVVRAAFPTTKGFAGSSVTVLCQLA